MKNPELGTINAKRQNTKIQYYLPVNRTRRADDLKLPLGKIYVLMESFGIIFET